MKIILILLLSLAVYAEISLPKGTQQLLVVSSPDFNTAKADLQAYEKVQGAWRKVFDPFSVNLGRSGMGWGKGLIPLDPADNEPRKKEGDGRSPAGLFPLLSFFGYEDRAFNFPYLQVTSSTLCIDDMHSSDYNHIVQDANPDKYKSFEYMRRKDNLYKLGIVVGHNQEAVRQGGSCIFIHIQRGPGASTSGCTAMQEKKLLQIMKWLEHTKNPLLLQLPEAHLLQGFH